VIRINLQKEYIGLRRRENIALQLILFFTIVILNIIVLYAVDIKIKNEIKTIEEENNLTQLTIRRFIKQNREVDQLKKKLSTLQRKMELIDKLTSNRTFAINLLNSMVNSIIPGKMWLTSLTGNKKEIQIQGIALNDKIVSDFMKNLEDVKSPYKLDKSLLEQLKKEKVSEDFLQKIKSIEKNEYLEENFEHALELHLEKDLTKEYKDLILKYTTKHLFVNIVLKKTEQKKMKDSISLKYFDILGIITEEKKEIKKK